jgi:membrane protease YdiL (CAAX protease family)
MIPVEVASVGNAKAGAKTGGFRGYLAGSRDLSTSVVLVIPLFLFYQIGVLLTGGLRNGVDFVTNALFLLFDGNLLAYGVFNLVVLAGFGVALGYMRKQGNFAPRLIPYMLLESAIYAVLFGSIVIALINAVGLGGLLAAGDVPQKMTFVQKLVMSAGAGLYEEIVFRLFLMGGMFFAMTRFLNLPRVVAAAVAVLASSVIFSAAHHISEPFTMSAFTFRAFAGVLFALLFQARGFAIAAYTHALYDVWVMVFKNG